MARVTRGRNVSGRFGGALGHGVPQSSSSRARPCARSDRYWRAALPNQVQLRVLLNEARSVDCSCAGRSCGRLPGDQKPIEAGRRASHNLNLKRREAMPLVLHMPLYFEMDGEKILDELGRRRFFHAPNVRDDRSADKLGEWGEFPTPLRRDGTRWIQQGHFLYAV